MKNKLEELPFGLHWIWVSLKNYWARVRIPRNEPQPKKNHSRRRAWAVPDKPFWSDRDYYGYLRITQQHINRPKHNSTVRVYGFDIWGE